MKFQTQYDYRERVYTCSGDRVKPVYEGFYNSSGVLELKRTGEINTYDEIQSYKESCDIYATLKRFEAGDSGALSKVQGIYGDFTDMPKTYADMLNTVIKGERRFNSLPVDIRSRFNHNFAEFVSEIGTDSWRSKLSCSSPVVEKPVENKVSEVVTNE